MLNMVYNIHFIILGQISGLNHLLDALKTLNRKDIWVKNLLIILIKRLIKKTINTIYKKLKICQNSGYKETYGTKKKALT